MKRTRPSNRAETPPRNQRRKLSPEENEDTFDNEEVNTDQTANEIPVVETETPTENLDTQSPVAEEAPQQPTDTVASDWIPGVGGLWQSRNDDTLFYDGINKYYVRKTGEQYQYIDNPVNNQVFGTVFKFDAVLNQFVADTPDTEIPEVNPRVQAEIAAITIEDARVWLESKEYEFLLGGTKIVAKQIITSLYFGAKQDAYELFKYWNAVHKDDVNKQISLEESGIDINAVEIEIAFGQERERNEREREQAAAERLAPPTAIFQFGDRGINTSLFSREGGFHNIYSIDDGQDRLVGGVDNANLLIRTPKPIEEATSVASGIRNYNALRNKINLPVIYNSRTAAEQNYYLVEKIPNAYDKDQIRGVLNPGDDRRLQQVKEVLKENIREVFNALQSGNVAQESVPDFRPDNVMFRNNGELVYIDFSEPGENWQPRQLNTFVATYKGFIEQFAGRSIENGILAAPVVYQYLIRDLPQGFRDKMNQPGIDQALFS
ncbi:hypothetical protein D1816_09460 [Aquimarina sp. AD10]|uniref:hypothetical protein n=1 Tax=Aquimarina sp. AD10 TaxID=1714849 RepID=UPI000E51B746|nr:hypothetical protein [Aquimarina sp. AD10]AXT60567.1 hypothetical protein D1816_09460 [Aquimarina sp. AD10]RKN01659.1 hypothetical protein D7033_03325 [Aquimarina sp. AD10]